MYSLKELFQLPAEYEVNKKLTKKNFLNNPNLTTVERRKLNHYLISIDLVYDIKKLDNNEIILMDIEITEPWAIPEITEIIARSIPQYLFIYIHWNNYGQFVVLETKAHSKDKNRRVISGEKGIWKFGNDTTDFQTVNVIYNLVSILTDYSKNAKETINYCISILNGFGSRNIKQVSFQNKSKEEKWIEKGKKFNDNPFESSYDEEYDYCEYNQSSDYNCEEEDIDYAEKMFFISSACEGAYALYQEVTEDYVEDEWLIFYARCCAEVFNYLFNSNIPKFFYYRLGVEFYKREYRLEDNYYIDLVVELMEERY